MTLPRIFAIIGIMILLFGTVGVAQTVDIYGQTRIYAGNPSSGVGVNGVVVHLLDNDMTILQTTISQTNYEIQAQNPHMTSPDGIYVFEDVPYYLYYWVEIEVPEGYILATNPEAGSWWNANPRFVGDDFSRCFLLLESGLGEGHTIGFWGANAQKAVQGKTKGIQVTASEYNSYLQTIYDQFDGADYFPVEDVSSVGNPADPHALTYFNADDTFDLSNGGPNGMINKAKKQLLAVLLDVAAGNNDLDGIISADGTTISELIAFTADMINTNGSELGTAKDACDYVNNNMIVPDDWVPETYGWVVYGIEIGQELTITEMPESVVMAKSYPNPFNPETTITFQLPEATHVNLSVFNVNGQKVAELLESNAQAGKHSATWDATELPSGTYIYRLSTDLGVVTGKMLLIK